MATGFFGKLPASGDFVARGLPPGVRRAVDHWLTQVLAPYARKPAFWPPDGLRALIIAPAGGPLALLVLPSRDTTGRAFPLAAIAPARAAGQAEIDSWADQALTILQTAVQGGLDAGQLIASLDPLPPPGAGMALMPPLIWTRASPPQDPAAFVALSCR